MRQLDVSTGLRSLVLAFGLGTTLFASDLLAQEAEGGGSGSRSEISFHLGSLLPNQIEGVTEIQPFVGGRYAYSLGGSQLEFDLSNSRGNGVDYAIFALSLRGEMQPVPDLTTLFYVGPDVHYYRGLNRSSRKTEFGFHFGTGLMLHLSGPTSLRADMKFNMNPGTALYIGFGLVFHLGGAN